ncbi:SDR family NAD(P)-dependent oxidoreductase [Embleya sp. NPDC127516]|uniref:SDR family NAD(P)-dependent oxidoreductase n=1 Tax=Embleya sp. NPDC127516 TaxID=3363990 RepID=UPI0037FF76B9
MTNSEQTTVLITGANKGLGFEAARRLGELGWTIFLGSRDEGRGRAAADKLTDGGAKVVMVPLDVTSDESVTAAVRLVREHTDRLDVLINNAGAPGRGIAPADATVEEIHSVYDTNVYGPTRTGVRCGAPAEARRRRRGCRRLNPIRPSHVPCSPRQ